ncbi:MAG: fibronectin type III domain-containing protein [bacterium]|nr:fibronectin type III domain-containing protein [bacterium]
MDNSLQCKIVLIVSYCIAITLSFAQNNSDIMFRFYGTEPGMIIEVSRGPAQKLYQRFTGKSDSWSQREQTKSIILALLEGPTLDEQKSGLRSAIPVGTKLNSLDIKDGIVYADFSKELVSQGFSDVQVDEISDQFRVALHNVTGLTGFIYTIEGKSPAYYYPDTKHLREQLDRAQGTTFTGEKPARVTFAGGGPVNTSRVVPIPTNGLAGKNIFVSAGHGWYHNGTNWVLQRPYLYTMNEDYSNAATVNLFMIPMLQNAGAYVLTARERDTQIREIVVDNADGSSNPNNGTYTETGSWSHDTPNTGFANGYSPYTSGINPFSLGSTRLATVAVTETARAVWTPNIPVAGNYAVYVSYNRGTTRAPDARYFVHHSGGTTQFIVDQRVNGRTWVYLGTFYFDTGRNSATAAVVLTNVSTTAGTTVSADAVRFGGGVGLITRGTSTSGRYKYTEGAKYYAQYVGAPATTVYDLFSYSDYSSDYSLRGEFANWYSGAPNGPNGYRSDPGQGIPIDAMVTFHSDAGVYPTSIHGSLSIWYLYDQYGLDTFPDGRSRQLSYSLTTCIHNQTLSDLRALYTSTWREYAIWNSNYAEARRPNCPSVLLESFSHENMNDMMYALDPQFRHDLARATYKGILRFLAAQDGRTPVVLPLPPKDFRVINIGDGTLRLTWSATTDPLEPTATPTGYVVYRSLDGKGFDNGTLSSSTTIVISGLLPNTIYYFKVTAYNSGGESFPTEVLAARTRVGSTADILVVNGFERISRPEVNADTTGFPREDPGVWPLFNAPLIGQQTAFVVQTASRHGQGNNIYANYQELGNSFDYIIQHGKAIANAGYWFDSASKKAVENGFTQLTSYTVVDWICGEQHVVTPPLMELTYTGYPDRMTNKFKTFDANLQSKISTYLSLGKHLFISGSDIAWDLDGAPYASSSDRTFLNNIIKADFGTNDTQSGFEIIIDNGTSGYSDYGNWTTGTTASGKYGTDYRWALTTTGMSNATAIWRPTFPQSGVYQVYVWYSQGSNRASNAPYTVYYYSGMTTLYINQQIGGGQWNLLGSFTFSSGTSGYIALTNSAASSVVIADAVRFEPVYQVQGVVGSIFNGLTGIAFDNGTYGIYGVDQPDGIIPTTGAATSMIYSATTAVAGIQYAPAVGGRIVYLAFPFETIISETARNTVMSRILNFLFTGVPIELSRFELSAAK